MDGIGREQTASGRRRRPNRLRAFTLVEVLVVIGIIALLIAILLTTLSAARASVRQAQCASGQRELIAACFARGLESKGFFPLAGTISVPAGTSGYGSLPQALNDSRRERYIYVRDEYPAVLPTLEEPAPWPASLLPYVAGSDVPIEEGTLVSWKQVEESTRTLQLFRCPSAPAPTPASYGTTSLQVGNSIFTPLWDSTMDYALNEGLLGFSHQRQHNRWRLRGQITRVENAARMLVLSDANNQLQASQMFTWTPSIDVDQRVTLADAEERNDALDGKVRLDEDRHRGRTVAAFVDGHVEAVSHDPSSLRQVLLSN